MVATLMGKVYCSFHIKDTETQSVRHLLGFQNLLDFFTYSSYIILYVYIVPEFMYTLTNKRDFQNVPQS